MKLQPRARAEGRVWVPQPGKEYKVSGARFEAPLGQQFETQGTAVVLDASEHFTIWRWLGQPKILRSKTRDFTRMVDTGRVADAVECP